MSDQFLDEEGVPTAPSHVEADPVVEPAAEPAAEPLAPKRSSRLVWLTAMLGVVALASLAAAASLWTTLNSERDERVEVRRVSGSFAEAIHTYDFENLEASQKKVLALSTGNFRREYEKDFVGGLSEVIKKARAQSTGTATDVFLKEIEDGTATTLVSVNTVSTGAVIRMTTYVELRLVKVDGRWLVDGAEYIDFDTPVSSRQPGGSTTTTAPPN